MIALTQEKRDDLLAYGIAMIADAKVNGNKIYLPDKLIQLMEIALASLTAEPRQWVVHARVGDQFTTDSDYVANAEGMHGLRATPLFTAPPVPEIKFPEKLPCDVSVEPNVVFRIPKTADDLIEAKLISTYKSSGSRFVMPGNYRIMPLGRVLLSAENQSKEDKEV